MGRRQERECRECAAYSRKLLGSEPRYGRIVFFHQQSAGIIRGESSVKSLMKIMESLQQNLKNFIKMDVYIR
jgi:hypothetical protein